MLSRRSVAQDGVNTRRTPSNLENEWEMHLLVSLRVIHDICVSLRAKRLKQLLTAVDSCAVQALQALQSYDEANQNAQSHDF